MARTHGQHTLILVRKQANAKEGRAVWTQFTCLGLFRYVWFHSYQKHKHARSVRMWKAINASWPSSVYIYPEFISDSQPVSGSSMFQSKSRPQFFQQSTTLHSLLFYLSMWNELCNFFCFIFFICFSFWLVGSFCCLLLFLCSDISKKKKKTNKKDVFSM